MNQDYNNYNQNNLNPGYNGIPNNQPLNNNLNNTYTQPQVQQPIEPAQPVVTPEPVPTAQPIQQPVYQQPVPAAEPVQPQIQQPVQPTQPVVTPEPVPTAQPIQQPVNNENKKGSNVIKIILFIILFVAIAFGVIYLLVSSTSKKLICKSSLGNITIMYNEDGLTGYTTTGALTYNYDEQSAYAKKVGVDAYLTEFNEWFVTNTSGTCTIDGKTVESKSTNTKVKTVGEPKYGYVEVPENWTTFVDLDGASAKQWAYANKYIVSLDYIEAGGFTAEDYASTFMANMEDSNEVTDVEGAIVKIGKNKEYSAYQVYMYYPADKVYLITYWFEADDGNIHYIALEGPDGVEDYLSIPESFSINK